MKRFSKDGTRLTDCCGCYSTYCEGVLCCKSCYHEVSPGEGDGCEFKDGTVRPSIRFSLKLKRSGYGTSRNG